MSFRIGDTGCRVPLLIHLIDILLLGSGWTTLAPLQTGLSPAISDLRAFGSPLRSWPRPQPPLSLHKRTPVVTREPCWSNDPHRPEQRPALQRIAPRCKRATWTSTPWTKDLWTKVRVPWDLATLTGSATQSHPVLQNGPPHMLIPRPGHGLSSCRSALSWCGPPRCSVHVEPSLTPPADWPQVCLLPRRRHNWLAACCLPAGAQGPPSGTLPIRFTPPADLAGLCPALSGISSPTLLFVRFSPLEPRPNMQSHACFTQCMPCHSLLPPCSVPLKWAPDSAESRTAAGHRIPGSINIARKGFSSIFGTVIGPQLPIMAPRPRTVFTAST